MGFIEQSGMQQVRFIELARMLYGNREPSGMLYVRFIELACILSSTGEHVEFIEQSGILYVLSLIHI